MQFLRQCSDLCKSD